METDITDPLTARRQAALDRLAVQERALVQGAMIRFRAMLASGLLVLLGWVWVGANGLSTLWLALPWTVFAASAAWLVQKWGADREVMRKALAAEGGIITEAEWDADRRVRWQTYFAERRAQKWAWMRPRQ
ncbi:MAG: hypothetical protein SF002_09570 [Alphaproteobacteria bacterium]|nr:hypothetical protein [Alphaproteobacteria bacterium]